MDNYQRDFLKFSIEAGVLRFGEFSLKSGRTSPYFFNAGLFNTGEKLAKLGKFYADAIVRSGIEFDGLFGPAYKGIPLVSAVAIALYEHYGIDKPWTFNRKEAKDHGEGGSLVGSELQGRLLIIDDVITAGTAIRESMDLIAASPATLAAVCVSMDRQEKGTGDRSAIQELEQDCGVQVVTIAQLSTLIEFLRSEPDNQAILKKVDGYRQLYGVA